MPQSLRTFIAVKIDPEEALLKLRLELENKLRGESINWIDPKKMHLTLKFLGDTAFHKTEKIYNVLEEVVLSYAPFTIKLKGVGLYKSKGMPRILFVKPEDDKLLHLMAGEINEKLAVLGFHKETRPFSTHLTLARIKWLKNRMNFYQAIEKFEDTFFQVVPVQEIIFYKSILFPTGPDYTAIKSIPLKST